MIIYTVHCSEVSLRVQCAAFGVVGLRWRNILLGKWLMLNSEHEGYGKLNSILSHLTPICLTIFPYNTVSLSRVIVTLPKTYICLSED